MIPPQFDEQFLAWFSKKTERIWSTNEPMPLEKDSQERGWDGSKQQLGVHWLGGLSDQQINEIERHWEVRLPPDYRLFLKTLHCMNRKWTYFDEERMETREDNYRTYLNWQTNQKEIEERYESIIKGMLFDIQNGIWWSGWGEKPITAAGQEARVRALVAVAPRIIPLIGNCYLLIEPCQSGNPILSIQQTDIIVFSPDLYSFFLREIDMMQSDQQRSQREVTTALKKRKEIWLERLPLYRKIPFWGEFV